MKECKHTQLLWGAKHNMKRPYTTHPSGVAVVLSTGKLQHCTIKPMLEEGLGELTLKCRQLLNTNDMAIFVINVG